MSGDELYYETEPSESVTEADSPALVDSLHREHWQEHYSGMTERDFLDMICNRTISLPEKGVSPAVHMPIGWANGTSEASLGHQRGCEVLLVLPNVTGLETIIKSSLPEQVESARFLKKELMGAGINLSKTLVTYAVRFAKVGGAAYKQQHKTANAYFVRADIEKCCPKLIVTFGADAFKALFGPKAKLDNVRGNVSVYNGIPVVVTSSHMGFMAGYGDIDVFRSELQRAAQIQAGYWTKQEVDTSGYRVCETPEEVTKLCEDIRNEYDQHLSFDFEFGNDVAREEFSYPLSLQLGWAKGKAAFIKLRGEGGTIIHNDENLAKIVAELHKLLSDKKYQLVGQHIRTDVDVAYKMGIDIDSRIIDGFDTMLAHHALYGDSSQGLDHLCRKYTPEFGAYWADLEGWLDANGRKAKLCFGYRDIPYSILIPYGLRDADVTWRVAVFLKQELSQHSGISGYFYNIAMPAALHLLDVQRMGIRVDEARRKELHDTYAPVYAQLVARFRAHINWPDFNPGSKPQVASFLFSTIKYKDKKPAPDGVKVLTLDPITNTDKYPKQWDDIRSAGEEDKHSPSTKSNIIEILYKKYKLDELKWLKQLSVIGKFLSTYLAPIELNEFGVTKDGKGFHNNIWADGRVRTHLSQVSETGRLRSSSFNLQCNPKKQEEAALAVMIDNKFGIPLDEYKKRTNSKKCDPSILIPFEERLVLPTFKSCYIADEGYELLEADFKTAEVCIWAFCSGDIGLIKIIDQGRDVHSEGAAINFKLPEASELPALLAEVDNGKFDNYIVWVEKFKKERGALRVSFKSVLFGEKSLHGCTGYVM